MPGGRTDGHWCSTHQVHRGATRKARKVQNTPPTKDVRRAPPHQLIRRTIIRKLCVARLSGGTTPPVVRITLNCVESQREGCVLLAIRAVFGDDLRHSVSLLDQTLPTAMNYCPSHLLIITALFANHISVQLHGLIIGRESNHELSSRGCILPPRRGNGPSTHPTPRSGSLVTFSHLAVCSGLGALCRRLESDVGFPCPFSGHRGSCF